MNLKDAYKSLDEALIHGGIKNNVKVNLLRLESDYLKSSEINNKLTFFFGFILKYFNTCLSNFSL